MNEISLNIFFKSLFQGARGFPGTPGLPGIKGHRVSVSTNSSILTELQLFIHYT